MISPLWGIHIPIIHFINVVFPCPLFPTIANFSPEPIKRFILFKIFLSSLYEKQRLRISSLLERFPGMALMFFPVGISSKSDITLS